MKEKGKMSFGTEAFKGQKYSKLKKDWLKKGELFVDTEFPANNKSLFFSKVDPDIVWKRPNVRKCLYDKIFTMQFIK